MTTGSEEGGGSGPPWSVAPAAVAETHVSVVVFLGDRAYKVKKPLRTPFLDYSTREARRRACDREVALNCRLAPDVYLGVVDVVDAEGRPCEHLVAMRRMPAERRLATLARDGRATTDHLVAIARVMAGFHSQAERGPHIASAGAAAAVRRLWTDNVSELAAFTPQLIPPDDLAFVEAAALSYVDGRQGLFDRRVAAGRIVDGHGDLLAGDIFCLDDGPRILDCLEFDDRLRFGDVLLDVGFLAMDLEHLGRPELARSFLDAYRELSGETHPRSLEHHYVAYRALVRAKVSCLRAVEGDDAARPEATAFLDLCRRHLRAGAVRLVVVGGLPGTGKSTLAEGLGRQLAAPVLRSDEIRKERVGMPTTEHVLAPFGQGLYAGGERSAVYVELLRRAEIALAMGETVVLDATWDTAEHRVMAARVARATHSELVELCCECPSAVADERLASRLVWGADASDATPAIAAEVRARFEAWPTSRRVDTGTSEGVSLREALAHLGTPPATAGASTGA